MYIKVSEIFPSFQGEGRFTGMPTIFVRFFGCNLKCDGFGQKDPTNPETYILPYKHIDVTKYKSLKELPVFPLGCDSSYSWDPAFKSLATKQSEREIVRRIIEISKQAFNTDLISYLDNPQQIPWQNPITGTVTQLCFTGGEPMLQQFAMNYICEELYDKNICPSQITIETNATKPISHLNLRLLTQHLHFSCSPKLYAVSGEKDAIDYNVIEQYYNEGDSGAIKFVHNGSQDAWDQIDEVVSKLDYIVDDREWSFWIMPVGSTLESQDTDFLGSIATEAMKRGFNISHRTHISVFGNKIGT